MHNSDDEMYEEAGPELSESGQPIYRHEARDRELDFAVGDEQLIEAIGRHIEKHIGPVDTVYHEIISDLVHIDVHIVKATADRPYHVLVTSGMSALRMKSPRPEFQFAELCVLLPPTWKLGEDAFNDEANYWPVRWLKQLARMPHEYETWLWVSHSIPNGDPPEPFVPGTDLCGWMLMPALMLPRDFNRLVVGEDKTIYFWALWALHEDEMDLKLKKGAEALLEQMDGKGITDIVDIHRPSACEPRKRGWFSRR